MFLRFKKLHQFKKQSQAIFGESKKLKMRFYSKMVKEKKLNLIKNEIENKKSLF